MTDSHTHRRALAELHVCVVLWGFTAILGRLITLPALPLVWWRMLLVTLALSAWPRVWRGVRGMPTRLVATYAGIGGVVALHWLTFYASVKLANASVGATCMAVAPAITSLLGPWLAGGRIVRRDVAFGLLVVPGIAMVMGGIPASMYWGFWVGVLSAALSSVFVVLNKRFLGHHDAVAVTWIEMAAGFLLVAFVTPLASDGPVVVVPDARDAVLLCVLALACTLVPFSLSLATLRHLSAFTAQLAVNLEPIYSIAIAVAFLGEARDLNLLFYLGVTMVLGLVFGHAYLQAPARMSA